jgi:hypothetical protein
VTIWEWVAAPIAGNVGRAGPSEPTRRGKSEIKRAVIVTESGRTDGPGGRSAISEANLRVAASPGNRANVAASSQGSTFSRASAERTLSSIPLLSSPIGANRKSSNSEPREDTELDASFQSPSDVAFIEYIKPTLGHPAPRRGDVLFVSEMAASAGHRSRPEPGSRIWQ